MPLQRGSGLLLLTLILVYAALMIAGGSNMRLAFQLPHDPAIAAAFVAQHSWAIRLGSFFELVSAIALSIFMALSISWLRVPRHPQHRRAGCHPGRNRNSHHAGRIRDGVLVPDQTRRRHRIGRSRNTAVHRLRWWRPRVRGIPRTVCRWSIRFSRHVQAAPALVDMARCRGCGSG